MGGIVDSLLGSAKKEKSVLGELVLQSQDIGATRRSTERGTKTGTETGTKNIRGVTTATATLLADNVRRAIEGSVIALSRESGDNGDAIAKIAQTLAKRAGGAEAAINAQSAAIVAKARRDADLRVQRIQTDLAMQAGGSSANSYVAGATAEAKVNENVDLAALEANLRLQARNTGTEELSNAVDAFNTSTTSKNADVTALAQLLSVLKGAKTSETQTQNTTENSKINTIEKINSVANEVSTQTNRGRTRTDSITVGKSTGRDSPLQQFTSLIGAANSGP